jgi:hypothetical protein
MTRDPHKNSAASVRARLLTLAQNKGEDYQRVLGRYAIERFLYRLGRSPYRDKFAIKGSDAVYALDRPDSSANQGLGSTRMGKLCHPRC